MKFSLLSSITAFLTLIINHVQCQQETFTECITDVNATCAEDFDRVCLRNNATGTEECGNCAFGYIEHNSTCFNIDIIDEDFVQKIIDTYKPTLRLNLTLAQRVIILKRVALVISRIESRIPPFPFTLALGKFSVADEEELRSLRGTRLATADEKKSFGFDRFDLAKHALDGISNSTRSLQDLPTSVDWCNEGACTEVKNQQQCGCCWAASTAASVESAVYLISNTSGFLQSLSFQQLISCDSTNSGCNGGTLQSAYQYSLKNNNFNNQAKGGLATLNDYPFVDGDGTATSCNVSGIDAEVFLEDPKTVLDGGDGTSFSDRVTTMKQALSQQPVTIVMSANCDLFNSYSGGILTDDSSCGCDPDTDNSCIDHAIVMVGYDDTGDTPYWTVRNSWGSDWGDAGYFLVASESEGEGGYGLFNLLYEGMIPYKAYNDTAAVADDTSSAKAFQPYSLMFSSLLGYLLGVAYFLV